MGVQQMRDKMGKLKLGLLTGVMAFALSPSAYAAPDSAIIIWNGANPADAESALGTGGADLAVSNLDGVTVTLSTVSKGTSPNDLTEGNIGIKNTTTSTQVLHIIAGANGYVGPTDAFTLTGTIGATLGLSDLTGSFFADSANDLNGQSLSVTGTFLNGFDSGSLTGPKSFSFNGIGVDALTGTYGLAEELTLTLAPGATVFVQGVSMDATNAVPEPSTWAMMGIGFGLVALLGLKKRKTARFLAV
jgi:PEP-CTERM motif